jgi:transcription-repair coupling factor (superfamily II helicase)
VALPVLLDALEGTSAFQRVRESLPTPKHRLLIGGLVGSADAVFVAALARSLPQRQLAVVAADVSDAERWLADLESIVQDVPTALYPPREGLGEIEPHAEVAGERIETLERMGRGAVRIVVTTARALLERTPMPRRLAEARLELRQGESRRPEELAAHLERVGFERVPMVEDVGQFAVRGGIFDIYGFGMADPVRLEFWGDEITELRHFDLHTQRSTRAADVALVLPVDGTLGDGEGGASDERIAMSALWPDDTLVVVTPRTALHTEWQRTYDEAAHHLDLARRRGEDVVSRDQLYRRPDEASREFERFGLLFLVAADDRAGAEPPPTPDVAFPLRAPDSVDRDIAKLRRLVRDGMPTLILCDNSGQADRLDELLNENAWDPSPAALVLGVLGGGFVIPPGTSRSDDGRGLRVLTDHEVFRRERRIRRVRKYATAGVLEMLGALKPGDYVVHLEHGVGIYRGIDRVFVKDTVVEAAVLEYEGGDRLNVPLYRIDQIERYRAAGDVSDDTPPPRLHKLGGRRWSAQRDKTRAAIHELTVELLQLYARRKTATREPHAADGAWQKQLESAFLFEDTPDQRKATVDIKKDMEGERPMDRLLVGDVGYGKTEIAVRAAFKAVQSGRQVAVLVPTTILAEQHARTFGDRFADFPVRIAVMSRFQGAKAQNDVLTELAKGTVDIVIGTHRLLSPDVTFTRLGLIIVDEEHRFGVKHKERLKQLKLETDVLTLTATPIPRTLHQSLAGLRDMTLMQTPPRDRSPVLTFIEPWDDGLIEEAVARELDRGGQVYFVHNRIETIEAIADHLRRVAPRARIAVGHGQMKEHQLEDVMRRFVAGEIDILVSTLIVESGLDVPNANTMFVNRADYFGLAQLYQLRGRVGRSHRRAYCYLVVPDVIDEDAEKRLQVLEHHTELGAGYRVALKDLELRGAGNLLGPEQSGFVQTVGFDLYLRMLDEQVKRLTQAEQGGIRTTPADVSLDGNAYLPDDFVASAEAKLDLYRRLSGVAAVTEIDALQAEVRDRFGPLPDSAVAFFEQARLRLLGGLLGVEGVLVRGNDARINFRPDAIPRMKGLSAAFHQVQFATEVRRTQPLSLKLTRLGGSELLSGLVHAFRSLVPE